MSTNTKQKLSFIQQRIIKLESRDNSSSNWNSRKAMNRNFNYHLKLKLKFIHNVQISPLTFHIILIFHKMKTQRTKNSKILLSFLSHFLRNQIGETALKFKKIQQNSSSRTPIHRKFKNWTRLLSFKASKFNQPHPHRKVSPNYHLAS